MVDYNKLIVGFLIVLISSSIVYVTLGSKVRLRVDEDRTTIYTKNALNRWIVSGREYNKLFKGTSLKYRDVSNIRLTTTIEGDIITISRYTPFKVGPVIIDTYVLDGSVDDEKLVPVSHTVEVINGVGFIYQYEVRDVVYDGETIKNPPSPISFGRNINVEWDSQAYWSTVYKSEILKVRFRPTSNYEKYSVRLYDPVYYGIELSKIWGNCYNHTEPTYGNVTYDYTCETNTFNYTLNPKYAWCWSDNLNSSGSHDCLFQHSFDGGNIQNKYIWWNQWEQNGTEVIETCEVIGYQVNNKKLMFENFPFRCWINTDLKCVLCKSTIDGDGKPPITPGDGTSWCGACIVDGSIKTNCKDDVNFMKDWRLT